MSGTLSPGFADAVGEAQACLRLVLDAMAHPGRVHVVRPVPAPRPLCDAAAAVVLTLVDQETPLWLDPDAAAARVWIAFHTGAPVVDAPGRAMFAVALSFPASSFAASFAAAPPASAQAAAAPPSPVMAAALAPASVAMQGTVAPASVIMGAAVAPLSVVMAGAGPASTPYGAGCGKGVDGGPPPAMTRDAEFPIGTDEAPETSATLILQIASLTTGRRYRLEGPGLRQPAILAADGLPPDFAAIWQRNHARFPCGIDLLLCAGNQLAALPRSVSVQEA